MMKTACKAQRRLRTKLLGGGLMLCLSLSSLISIGFGSYLIGASTDIGPFVIEAGDVVSVLPDYGTAASFVIGSESGINYYMGGVGIQVPEITDSTYEIRIRINPYRMDENSSIYGNNEVSASLGLSYSSVSGKNFFDGSLCVPPTSVSFVLEGKESALVNFPLTYELSDSLTGETTYTLMCDFPLYSTIENSLYSVFKRYQKGTNNIYLSARFAFDMNSLSNADFSTLIKTPINFVTTLSGVSS